MSEIYKAFRENEEIVRKIVARYRPHKEDIEDLLQETFVKCFAASLDYKIIDPRAFIFKVARNLAISEAKRKRHSTTNSIEDFVGLDVYEDKSVVSLEAQVYDQRKLAIFTRVLAELPDDLRRALIMRKIEGLKFKQIATRLDVSVSTIEKRVAAALLQCNDKLRARGYNLSEKGQKNSNSYDKKTGAISDFLKYGNTNTGNSSPKD